MTKKVIKSLLWIQLVLLILRQVIDFLGVQWLMILMNFLSILVTISALFHYFLLFFFFQFLLIFYNFLVIFCYFNSNSLHFLSFDSNSKSFFHFLVQNYFQRFEDKESEERVVKITEVFFAFIHSFLSFLLSTLLVFYLQKLRKKAKQQNFKTTPPLPPYTISPIVGNNAFTTSRPQSLRRQSKRRARDGERSGSQSASSLRRSSLQKNRRKLDAKLITNSAYYSDSETDFYGHSLLRPHFNGGLNNPLYCQPMSVSYSSSAGYGQRESETRI